MASYFNAIKPRSSAFPGFSQEVFLQACNHKSLQACWLAGKLLSLLAILLASLQNGLFLLNACMQALFRAIMLACKHDCLLEEML